VAGSTAAARVLLADDTPDIRALLRLVLSRHDDFVVVAEAADGSEAVEMAQKHRPDVVLLDLAMPVMDGLEAIPGVRAAAPNCKIVVLSGFNADQMAAEALGAGADAYLEKGTPPTQLVHHLRRICGLREVGPESPPAPIDLEWGPAELSVMTHELMNPLAVIEGFASLLERRPDAFAPETVSEHAAIIGRSARQLRALLQNVTDARRLEVGDLVLHYDDVDVVALVREVAQDIAVVEAPDPVTARVDPVRLRQVVTNLVSNAVKFSPRDAPPTEVRVVSEDGWVRVSVRDHGPGIPVERRGELFQRFSRLGATVKGMGLGLYISRGIARAHGGDLRLVETASGPGATFELRLPR
jgi:CheY-like chemotaxis protein